MLPYLTPERYNVMGLGSTTQDKATLLSLIHRASLAVDRFLNVPVVPTRYSFRGGSVTDEEHSFELGNDVHELPRREIWPRFSPLKSVSQLRVYVTNTQYVEFDASELFITKDSAQITSLTLTHAGLFGAMAIPIMGLRTPVARMSYTYGYDFDAVDETLEADSTFTTYRAQNQFWNADDVVVKKNGTVETTGFTVDKTEGKVTFASALTANDVVTASYGYDLLPEVAEATGLTVAKSIDDQEMRSRGMGNLQSLSVGEIDMERPRPRSGVTNYRVDLPDEAKQLLDGLNFITIR